MKYKLVKINNNKKFYLYILILLILIIIFYLLFIKYKNYFEYFSYNLGVCSSNCCATQWNIPNNLKSNDNIDPDNNPKYIRANMSCNNGVNNTGCVCLTQESKDLLTNRGNKKISYGNGLLNKDNNKSGMNVFKNYTLSINNNIV